MKIYRFDKDTKEYTVTADAQPSPLEPGKYLIPATATTVEPPEAEDGYVQCWDGTAWVKTEDHRQKRDKGGVIIDGSGTPYWLSTDTYETRARYMTVPGPLPTDALLEQPAKPFELQKSEKLSQLKSNFNFYLATLEVASTVEFTSDGNDAQAAHINGNDVAMLNIMGLISTMSDTDTVEFCDYNNEFHAVTKAQLSTMLVDIAKEKQIQYKRKWMLRDQINAATTVEELDAINITF